MYGTWTRRADAGRGAAAQLLVLRGRGSSRRSRMRDRIGVEHILLESDYPHCDSTWPRTQQVIDEEIGAPARRRHPQDHVGERVSVCTAILSRRRSRTIRTRSSSQGERRDDMNPLDIVCAACGDLAGTAADTPHGPVRRFAGIPFGAPPVGDRRFRAAEPVPRWEGVRNADEFGPSPMQAVEGPFSDAVPGMKVAAVDEDCLSLNVWTPAAAGDTDGAPLPVMMWVYGGAFVIGGGAQPTYDGARLCGRAERRRRHDELPRRRVRVPRSAFGARWRDHRHELRHARSRPRAAVDRRQHRRVRWRLASGHGVR